MNRSRQYILNILLGIAVSFFILPLLLVISISLTSEHSIAEYGFRFFPSEFSIKAYEYLFTNSSRIVRAFIVSVIVTLGGSLLAIFLMSLYAYALSRKDFAFRRFFMFYIFFTMLFNGGLVPTYLVIIKLLHLQDNLLALIVPLAFNAFFTIILRTFFQGIPESIIESGRMDGAKEWRIFFSLVFPLAIPGISTVALFVGVGYWNDWFQALLYIRDPFLLPLQSFLSSIQKNIEVLALNPNLSGIKSEILSNIPTESSRMAIVILTTLPILVSYPFFQKFFISGLTVGSVKE
ncbi:MAG: carbohydrate ABC transporter permease [Spirochaetota bacterium]